MKEAASGMSSKPTTLTSCGTRRPRSWKARSTPRAIWSLATNTAVQSACSASRSPARYPDSGVQSPRCAGGTRRPSSRSTACQASDRRSAAKDSSGPETCQTVSCPRSSRCCTAVRAPCRWSVSTTGKRPVASESTTTTLTCGGRVNAVVSSRCTSMMRTTASTASSSSRVKAPRTLSCVGASRGIRVTA